MTTRISGGMGQIMRKAFFALQLVAAVAGLAVGIAMVGGSGLMTKPLDLIGLGQGFRVAVGSLEVVGGLCLLFPRSGPIGAVLLTSVMISTLGASFGHVGGVRANAPYLAIVKAQQGWDI